MATALLHFPAFCTIEGDRPHRYHAASAALAPELRIRASSAAGAIEGLRDRVREAARQDMDLCRALCAVPEDPTDRVETLEVTAQRERVRVPLRLLLFERNGQRWAVLPRPQLVLPLPPVVAEIGPSTGLQAALDAALRKRRPTDEEVADWADRAGDRVEIVSARVELRWPPVSRELDLSSLLQGASGPSAIDGRVELGKVGEDLARRHPDRLLRARVPHPAVEALHEALFTGRPQAIALLGPPGVGRTTLIHSALSQEIERVAAEHSHHRAPTLWQVDPNRVISGQSIVGAWQRRFQAILGWLAKPGETGRPDVLYVDNALALARVGRARGSALTLSALLRPWLERAALPTVVEATPEAWLRLEELDRPLADLFRIIRVDPPAPEIATRMVLANLPTIEAETGARFDTPALRELLARSARGRGDRVSPGAPIDVLRDLGRRLGGPVSAEAVRGAFADESGLRPEWLGDDGLTVDPAALRASISARLAGQPEAVDFIARCLLLQRAGLARPGRPLASALLVGPTGVGKTETARVLASLMFQGEGHLLRFDMGELVDADAPRRLIGDLYTEGSLTSRVRHRPTAVVLLDEIEKAHPSVLDLLLQVLDEGRLTDGRGQRADFQRAVVLMTSNVGAAELGRGTGFLRGGADLAASFRGAAERHFRPELLNRIDRILAFAPLSREDLRTVAGLQATRLLAREGLQRRVVFLDLPRPALDRLADLASRETGARALKRAIEREIATPLAQTLLDLPPDAPLRLRAREDGPGFDALPLPIAPARRDPDWRRRAPSLRDLRLALERARPAAGLLASAGPGGTVWHGSDLPRQIAERLGLDEDEAPEEIDEIGLTEAQLRRLKGRGVKSRLRGWGYSMRVDLFAACSARSVRQYLLEATAEARAAAAPPADEDADLVARALAGWQLRHLPAGDETVILRARGVAGERPGLWRAFAPWLASLRDRTTALGGRLETRRLDPATGAALPDARDELPGERRWELTGCGLRALLAGDVGVHALWLDDQPPLGLQIDLCADPRQPWPEPSQTVGLYLARSRGASVEVHEATDAGLGLSWPGLDAMGLEPWMWHALEQTP